MPPPQSKPRWHHLTPTRFFVGLLAVQVLLFLSERFQWFPFNEKKGWTVLIAVGVVGLAVLVMLGWGLVCLILRRRFQFGVRSLLVFMVAVSVPLGWFAWEMQKARRQREVVERIVAAGAVVVFNYQGEERWVTHRLLAARAWWPHELVDGFSYPITKVDCSFLVQFGDDEAKLLRSLSTLEELNLGDTQVSDESVESLTALTNLKLLVLTDTQVSDEEVQKLRRALPNCTIDR